MYDADSKPSDDGPFVWPIRVYYEDTDAGGVVYYANYLKFMERARTEWLRARGYGQATLREREGVLFIVRSVTLDYRRPARLDDRLEVLTRIVTRNPASLVFEQRLVPTGQPGDTLCSGTVKVACIDAQTFRPRPIPRVLLTEIAGDG